MKAVNGKVKFYLESSEINDIFKKLILKSDEVILSLAWATVHHPAYDLLLANKDKISKFYCGIERHLTSPKVLEDFKDHPGFFVVEDPELFHHKCYIFKYKDEGKKASTRGIDTLISSANFTNGGFQWNFEIMQHTSFDNLTMDLENQLETHLSKLIRRVDDDFITNYKINHSKAKDTEKNRKKSSMYKQNNFYNMNWDEFVERVCRDKHHQVSGRLQLLSMANEKLEKYKFKQLDEITRKKIAGTYSNISKPEEYDSRWFGGMSNAGYFSGKVRTHYEGMSDALDLIPMEGEITEEMFNTFIANMRGDASGYSGSPLGVCTRLLAMKRPDYFFCITSQNIELLAKDLKFTKGSLDVNTYWRLVVEPLINSEWWQSRSNLSGEELKIWKGRVAMLDSLYYVPSSKNNGVGST